MKAFAKIKITFIIALLIQTISYSSQGWFYQNPLPQGVSLTDIHVINEIKAIAVGQSGTFIKTIDGGINWSVQHFTAGIQTTLNDVDFANESIGWAVGDEGTILKSTDGGETWEQLEGGYFGDLYAIFSNNEDIAYIAGETNDGSGHHPLILKTIDGGNSWKTIFKDLL
jgi:photosystem II stability/assembly factor-like uncharacterized protein